MISTNEGYTRLEYFSEDVAADKNRKEFDIKNHTLCYTNQRPDFLFIGDSITEYWELNAYFRNSDQLIINRGIAGDTTKYLKKRFYVDAVQLKPKYCILGIGINDSIELEGDYWKKLEPVPYSEKLKIVKRIIENEGEDYYFKEICKWVKKDSWVKKCFVRGYLDLLIGTLSMRVNKFDKNTGKVTEKNENPVLKIAKRKEQIDSRVQLVADYVVLHPREKYTPQKMAEMVELSKQRFSSLFKANMGKSPMEYVREIRLTTAARALLVSNKNINDIAYECGYEDANYFIREFKSAFGFTPNQYRKIARE